MNCKHQLVIIAKTVSSHFCVPYFALQVRANCTNLGLGATLIETRNVSRPPADFLDLLLPLAAFQVKGKLENSESWHWNKFGQNFTVRRCFGFASFGSLAWLTLKADLLNYN